MSSSSSLSTREANEIEGLKPWNVSITEFPFEGKSIDKLKFFIKFAILAPSSHNTQPWLFGVKEEDDTIENYADRTRALSVVDPYDRALTISCGAALFQLQIAISFFGYSYETKLATDINNNNDLLASIRILNLKDSPSNKTINEDQIIKLFSSITKRRTNRFKYDDKTIPEEIVTHLKSIITRQQNVWFYIATEKEEKEKMADLVTEGDRIQMSDKRFRRELASWIHYNRNSMRDGMPGYAFGFGDMMSLMGPFVLRTFDLGKGQAAKDKDLALGSPVLVVIETDSDKVEDWLNTGMALSNALLYLRSENIWYSFLNQPIEVPELRSRLGDIIPNHSNKYPQIILRIGYSKDNDEIKPTPRRDVQEVLLRS